VESRRRIHTGRVVAGHETLKLEFRGAVHHHDSTHPLPQPSFDQQRDIHHDHFFASQPSLDDAPQDRAGHGGVYDSVEDFPLFLVVEDDAAEFLAVDGA